VHFILAMERAEDINQGVRTAPHLASEQASFFLEVQHRQKSIPYQHFTTSLE